MKYNVLRNGTVINQNGKTLKPRKQSSGYQTVLFSAGKTRTEKLIHRLVAETYIPNPLNLPEVNHINGDKTNNNDWNLEWCTKSHNTKHAYNNGLRKANTKLTKSQVSEIRLKYKPYKYSMSRLAKEYNVHHSCIQAILENKLWKE